MNLFLERLPLRIAALAGLLVGAVSLARGIDLWIGLLRAGVAFLVFGLLGLALRSILLPGGPPAGANGPKGTLLDQTTPPMTPGDLTDADAPGANSERP